MLVQETEEIYSQILVKSPKKDLWWTSQTLDISQNENFRNTPATSSSKTKETLLKSPHVSVSVNEETIKTPTTVTSSIEENKSCDNEKPKTPQTVSDTAKIINTVSESDDNKPGKRIPVITPLRFPGQAEKFVRCQPQDSEESSTSSLSSASDDSESSIITVVGLMPTSTSTSTSKVSLHDHGTLQKNTYSTPSGTTPTNTTPLKIPRGDRVGRKIDVKSLFGSYSTQVAPTDEQTQRSSNNG